MVTSQGRSLIKNTLIYAIGNLGSRILSFLLLPLYSFYLTTYDFGVYDLVIATIAFLNPIVTVQISDSVYRWLLETGDDDVRRSQAISGGAMITLIFTGCFCVIYYVVSLFLKVHIYDQWYFIGLLLSSCYLPFFQQVARGIGNNKLYATAGIINTFFILTSNICFLAIFKFGLNSLFLATILSNIITIVYISAALRIKRFISVRGLDKSEIKKMLKYSWPLIPNSISWWLINIADKYIILYILGVSSNGIYAVSSRFPAIINVFNSIFLMAWQDQGITTESNSENSSFFSKTFNLFITFELTLVIFLISISKYLIKFLIAIKFYESYKYLPFLYIGVAYAAFAAYVGVGYQRNKATKAIFKTTVVGGVINVTTSLLLLKYIGLYAPALGTLLSFSAIYAIRKRETNSFFPINVNTPKLIILTLVSLFYYVQFFIDNIFFNLSLIGIAVFLFVFLNRSLFLDIFSLINKKRRTA